MEVWCPISGFPNYIVSNYGNIYSQKTNNLLSSVITPRGYLQVDLSKNNVRTHYSIHRLVALHFLPTTGDEVDHIDRDKLNNNISNLRWCSRSENMRNKRKKVNCSSQYKGVSFDKSRSKWSCEAHINNKKTFLGRFDTEEEAGRAYDDFCRSNNLSTALNNFP